MIGSREERTREHDRIAAEWEATEKARHETEQMEEERKYLEEERKCLEEEHLDKHLEEQMKQEEQAWIKADLEKQLAKDEEKRMKLVEECIKEERKRMWTKRTGLIGTLKTGRQSKSWKTSRRNIEEMRGNAGKFRLRTT